MITEPFADLARRVADCGAALVELDYHAADGDGCPAHIFAGTDDGDTHVLWLHSDFGLNRDEIEAAARDAIRAEVTRRRGLH